MGKPRWRLRRGAPDLGQVLMETERRASLCSLASPKWLCVQIPQSVIKTQMPSPTLDVVNHSLQGGVWQVCFRSPKVILTFLMMGEEEESTQHSEGIDPCARRSGGQGTGGDRNDAKIYNWASWGEDEDVRWVRTQCRREKAKFSQEWEIPLFPDIQSCACSVVRGKWSQSWKQKYDWYHGPGAVGKDCLGERVEPEPESSQDWPGNKRKRMGEKLKMTQQGEKLMWGKL